MGNIYNSLENLYKIPLVEMAKKLAYHQSNIYVLENRFDKLQQEFPLIYNALISCVHNRDKRSYQEYAKDLISSWIFEDTMLKYLNTSTLKVTLNGSDKSRLILENSKVESSSDYLIFKDKSKRYLELINSYTSYWSNVKRIELRDNKYQKMKFKNALLLCIDIYANEFYIIDVAKQTNVKYIEYHKAYGKPAYSIDIKGLTSNKLNLSNIIQQLEIAIDY